MILLGLVSVLSGCQSRVDSRSSLLVSVPDQRMVLLYDGKPEAMYSISTSRFGLGDKPGSYATPTGRLRIAKKIGGNLPSGAVMKARRPTGEILAPNAPGRDPIVSRILWLEGLEARNQNAFNRMIYIHGTNAERSIGRPSSFGCIRMRSDDVIDLYNRVGVGATVEVSQNSLPLAWRTLPQSWVVRNRRPAGGTLPTEAMEETRIASAEPRPSSRRADVASSAQAPGDPDTDSSPRLAANQPLRSSGRGQEALHSWRVSASGAWVLE